MSPASSSSREPRAAIFGASGKSLTDQEKKFFRSADPLGFILFARNVGDPAQLRNLVIALRDTVRRADAPVLIDQEGGRVARLKPPHWRGYPPASAIAAAKNPAEAAFLGSRLIADDLAALGITVDCAPVLDLPAPGADPIIGDRAYGTKPETVAALGRAVCDGLLAGGVLPVIKHIPGHGRARVDSHLALPVVSASRAELEAGDFAPFRALNRMPWAMTAHIVYSAIDADAPATLSPRLISQTIRASIGFGGVLISDDLSMKALPGSLPGRAQGALEAGCDVVLHCNGEMREMSGIARAVGPLSAEARRRIDAGERRRLAGIEPFERFAAEARLAMLLEGQA